MYEDISSQIAKVTNLKYLTPIVLYKSSDKHYYLSLLYRIQSVGVHYILCSRLKEMDIKEEIPQLIEIMIKPIDGSPISHPIYNLLLLNAKRSKSFRVSLFLRLKSVLSTVSENVASHCYFMCCDILEVDSMEYKRNIKGLSKRCQIAKNVKRLCEVKNCAKKRIIPLTRQYYVHRKSKLPDFHGLMLFFAKAVVSVFNNPLFGQLDDYSSSFQNIKIYKNIQFRLGLTGFKSNVMFYENLADISCTVKKMPQHLRQRTLKILLEFTNIQIGNEIIDPFHKGKKIVKLVVEHAKTQDSAENCPFVVIAECADKNLEEYNFYSTKVKKAKALLKQLESLNDLDDIGDIDGIKESIVCAVENVLFSKSEEDTSDLKSDIKKPGSVADLSTLENTTSEEKPVLNIQSCVDFSQLSKPISEAYKVKIPGSAPLSSVSFSNSLTEIEKNEQVKSEAEISVKDSDKVSKVETMAVKKDGKTADCSNVINIADASNAESLIKIASISNAENVVSFTDTSNVTSVVNNDAKSNITDSLTIKTLTKTGELHINDTEKEPSTLLNIQNTPENLNSILKSTANLILNCNSHIFKTEAVDKVCDSTLVEHLIISNYPETSPVEIIKAENSVLEMLIENNVEETENQMLKNFDTLVTENKFAELVPSLNFEPTIIYDSPNIPTVLKHKESNDFVDAYACDLPDSKPLALISDKTIRSIKENLFKTSKHSKYPGWDIASFIVKSGGILKHEYLAYQALTQMKEIFIIEKLPIYLKNYQIVLISDTSGLVETVQDAQSIHRIKYETKFKTILSYFEYTFKNENFKLAKQNFLYSLVGYSLASYILQIKDRHNGNILIDSFGHIIHVDFGFTFGKFPGIVSIENAPFKFSAEYLDLIDLEEFKTLFIKGFKALRKHREKATRLIEIMKDSGYYDRSIYEGILQRFRSGDSDADLELFCNSLITNSMDSKGTAIYDHYQYYYNGYL